MLDRHRRIAGFVGDDRKVVVRTGVPRIDADGALQQIARIGARPAALWTSARLTIDSTLRGSCASATRSSPVAASSRPARRKRDAEVVVGPHVLGIEAIACWNSFIASSS